jgi:hypothetical protein
MKRLFGVLAVTLAAAVPLQGQISDGATGTATFLGNTSTTNAPWFEFNVNTGSFNGNVDFMCVDANRYVYQNTLYNVSFLELSSMTAAPYGYDLDRLRDAALAYDAIAADPNLRGELGAQLAVWDLMGTRAGSQYGSTPTAGNWAYNRVMTHVTANRFGGPDFSRYAYYLMVGETADGYNRRYNVLQPQLTRVGVPEPGMTVLLASGLLGLLGVGFRRRVADA